LIESYRSSVNRWECDENDHLNVRFYVDKHMQTIIAGLANAGFASSSSDTEGAVPGAFAQLVNASVRSQHLRFVRESRLSAPITGSLALVAGASVDTPDSAAPHKLNVLSELRHSSSGELLCSCITSIDALSWNLGALPKVDVPEDAGSRGVPDSDIPFASLSAIERAQSGFKNIGMGVVQAAECGSDGHLLIPAVMGRISDSMPHLWGLLRGSPSADKGSADEGDAEEGGAVLEYRLRYHRSLRQGELFRVESGLMAVGTKRVRCAG